MRRPPPEKKEDAGGLMYQQLRKLINIVVSTLIFEISRY